MKTHREVSALLGAAMILVMLSVPAAGTAIVPVPPPGVIEIDNLPGQGISVFFDHELHNGYASCVECHHHVTGLPPSNPVCASCHRKAVVLDAIGCRDCHVVERFADEYLENQNLSKCYHFDTVGLQGAYHLRCINCHLAIGTGPVGCHECH
jgi:hypothetical protein